MKLNYWNVFLCFFLSGTISMSIGVVLKNNFGLWIGVGFFIASCITYWVIPEKPRLTEVEQ